MEAEMLPSFSLAETAARFEVTASRLALLKAVRMLSSSSTELELVLLMIADAKLKSRCHEKGSDGLLAIF